MDCKEIINCEKYDPSTNKPNIECMKKVMEQLKECQDNLNYKNLANQYLLKYGINYRR
jgi:hypothetical protein